MPFRTESSVSSAVVVNIFASVLVLGIQVSRGDDVVYTEHQTPLKVVVRTDTAAYELPESSARNRPVKRFQFFYVLKHKDAENGVQAGFYRVGTGKNDSDFLGYIPVKDVIVWPHREALGFRPTAGRERIEFFRSRDDLTLRYRGSAAKAISREPRGGGGLSLVPILSRFTVELADDEVEAYEVAFLQSRGRGKASVADGPSGIDLTKSTLDVVFVIDATGSMDPFISAVKDVVQEIADRLSDKKEQVRVRFGLVAYRDHEDNFVSKVFCDLPEGETRAGFDRHVSELRADGGGDTPEDVFAGVKAAAVSVTWNPNAFRHIILIGDASAHSESSGAANTEKLDERSLLKIVQPRGREAIQSRKVLHAIRVVRSEESDADDQKIQESQFRTLAAGDGIPGEYFEFDGTSGIPSFTSSLVNTILKSRSGLANAVAGSAPASQTPGLGLLLEMMEASEIGGDAPEFAQGFACETDLEGNQALEPYVLVERQQLELFVSSLDFTTKLLGSTGKGGERKVEELISQLQSSTLGVSLGEITPQMTMSQVLERASGLPVKSKVFDLSLERIAAMTTSDFDSWLDETRLAGSLVQGQLDNVPLWFSLDAPVPLQRRSAFIRVRDLP